MRIAGFLPVSLVNGEGVRMVVFLQGCGHRCPGCQNPGTWDFNGGHLCTAEEIANFAALPTAYRQFWDAREDV